MRALPPRACPSCRSAWRKKKYRGIGPENVAGHYTAWNYYQTTDTPENEAFVAAYKAAYGDDRVTSDPAEAGYFGVYLWKAMVEAAGSTEVADVKAAAATGEITYAAPGGLVTVDADNQHTYKTVRIGQVNAEGLIDEVYSSPEPVKPDPFLENIEWAEGLAEGMSQ